MRASSGKLDHDRALATPIAVARMIDEFTTYAIGVQIGDHGRCLGSDRHPILAIGDTGNLLQRFVSRNCLHQAAARLFTFSPHNRVDMRFLRENFAPEIGRVNAAINYGGLGQCQRNGGRHP